MKSPRLPLRISNDRIVLYGVMLALIASTPFIIFPTWFHDVAYRGDFANFWSAGSNVGTTRLLDAAALAAWQTAHGITAQVFVYPPGVAWLYAPLAWLPPIPAMILGDAAMVAALAAAGIVMAKIYGFPRWFALAGVFAWGPAVNAIELGQNTPLALLAICVAIWSLVNRREALLGLAVGLLLYKPSVALPFVLLLLVRSQWRALAVVAAAGAGWYPSKPAREPRKRSVAGAIRSLGPGLQYRRVRWQLAQDVHGSDASPERRRAAYACDRRGNRRASSCAPVARTPSGYRGRQYDCRDRPRYKHPCMAIRGDTAAPSSVLLNGSDGGAGTNSDHRRHLCRRCAGSGFTLRRARAGLALAWHRGMVAVERLSGGGARDKIVDVPVGQSL